MTIHAVGVRSTLIQNSKYIFCNLGCAGFSVMLVLLTLAVVAQVCCVLLFLHVCFLGLENNGYTPRGSFRVVDNKGRRPPAQDSVPSIYVVVVVAAFAAVVVIVDAVVVAQARRHTAHTHTRSRTRSSSRTPTHTHTHITHAA